MQLRTILEQAGNSDWKIQKNPLFLIAESPFNLPILLTLFSQWMSITDCCLGFKTAIYSAERNQVYGSQFNSWTLIDPGERLRACKQCPLVKAGRVTCWSWLPNKWRGQSTYSVFHWYEPWSKCSKMNFARRERCIETTRGTMHHDKLTITIQKPSCKKSVPTRKRAIS